MLVEQLYTSCLSEAAYFIASKDEAAVIDPLRDVDAYLQKAEDLGVKIKYIFETHFHADFVSGHVELSRRTGAPIIYGPGAKTDFESTNAKDGETFEIGGLTLSALHTPGHTLESTSYLLYNEQGKPYCIFTGDTLFVGDVGRPDLFSGNLTKEELAAKLYHSLQTKIKTLPDDVIVYPAHGPGSACGKNLGKETFSTIGEQKENNYALQEQTEEEFVAAVTTGLNAPPAYFPLNARINQQGYKPMEEVKEQGLRPRSAEAVSEEIKGGAWVLDTRPATAFTEGFIPGSVFVGLDGRFAEWAAKLIPLHQPLVLVTEPGKEEESLTRLSRVGMDNILGYLEGGIAAWQAAGKPLDLIIDVEADELAMDIPHDDRLEVLDVRQPGEYENGHVKGANNLPLSEFTDILKLAMVDTDANLYVHCAGGYRSVIACSLLKRQGIHNLRNVLGGWGSIKAEKKMPLVQPAGQKG